MHWQCAFYHASHGARSSSPARGAINSTVCFSVAVTTTVVVSGIAIIITEASCAHTRGGGDGGDFHRIAYHL